MQSLRRQLEQVQQESQQRQQHLEQLQRRLGQQPASAAHQQAPTPQPQQQQQQQSAAPAPAGRAGAAAGAAAARGGGGGLLAAGRVCEYRTNEHGWRKARILKVFGTPSVYNLQDIDDQWELDGWHAEHVRPLPAAVPRAVPAAVPKEEPPPATQAAPPPRAAPAAAANAPAALQPGQNVQAMYEGDWFPGVVQAVDAAKRTCDVNWAGEDTFTEHIAWSDVRLPDGSQPFLR